MNTHESYVSPETAKLLKKAGFDWEADTYYEYGILRDGWCSNKNKECMTTCSAPTLAVAQRWFREDKSIFISISSGLMEHIVYDCKVVDWHRGYNKNYYVGDAFNTYEEAQEAGIKKALEIIIKKGE